MSSSATPATPGESSTPAASAAPSAPTMLTARAILFDMDGTLVDDQPLIDRVWHAAVTSFLDEVHSPFGHPVHGGASEILSYARGRRTSETLAAAFPHWPQRQRDRMERMIETEIAQALEFSAPPMPGAAPFVGSLSDAGLPWIVVTSAPTAVAAARLKKAGIPVPEKLVGADDIANGKPAPDPFLAGARALDVDPAECIVFEDTAPGIESAIAAGTIPVVIGATPIDTVPGGGAGVPRVHDFSGVALRSVESDGRFSVALDAGAHAR